MNEERSSKNLEQRKDICKEIIVVSRNKGEDEEALQFPTPFKPLVPIGHEELSPNCGKISNQNFLNIGLQIEERYRSRAEFISNQQSVLTGLIREVDFVTSFLANNIVADRQKRVSKLITNINTKLIEIDQSLGKVDNDLQTALKGLEILNAALPDLKKLEVFSGKLINEEG
ncbi:hypothetical protein HDE_10368 [Halotydeus destructor]|nr:hypothetical protein HDE_10368 [Halotydeus destructor]